MKILFTFILSLLSFGVRGSAPADIPAGTPVRVPADTPAGTPAVTPAAVPVRVPAGTSAAAPADTAGIVAAPTLETLTAEVEALKSKTSAWSKVLERLPRISGYVQAGYEWSETSSTFFLKRVRLNLAGDILKKLDYRVQIEFCSPKIVDVYLRYRPFEVLNLQLGEYKLPFSIENTDYVPSKYELIEYPLSLRRLMGFDDICGLSATGRDMGAMLYGGFFRREGYSVLNYHIGVFNGEGLNTKDRNKSKDLCAKLTLRPVPGLQIAGSYYRGEYGADHRKRIRYGAGVCYDRGRVLLRGEYIYGTTGMPAAETAPAYDLDSEGWYAVAGWHVTPSLMPVVRYDTFREDASSSASRQTDYTAGLLWQPVKYFRCQLNYTYKEFAARSLSDRNVVAVMFTGIF